MERPRKQTYTVEMYLQRMKDLDIRSDQKVQRLSGQWNNAMTKFTALYCRWASTEHDPDDVPLWRV